jgi:hypothetical protein
LVGNTLGRLEKSFEKEIAWERDKKSDSVENLHLSIKYCGRVSNCFSGSSADEDNSCGKRREACVPEMVIRRPPVLLFKQ